MDPGNRRQHHPGDTPITITVTANGADYSSLASLITLPVGIHSVTVLAENSIGMDSCTFDVEVVDTENPVITVPLSITVTNDPGFCRAFVSFLDYTNTLITATDNCGIDYFDFVPASGNVFSVGTHTIEATAYDLEGNFHSGTFELIVVDGELPVLTLPASITVTNDPGRCDAYVSLSGYVGNQIDASDNCNIDRFEFNAFTPDYFSVGTQAIEVTVYDVNGNSTNGSFNLIVVDGEAPHLTLPASLTVSAASGRCDAEVSLTGYLGVEITAMDNCGIDRFEFNHPSPDTYPRGTNPIVVVVHDVHGNFTTNTFPLVIVDGEVPEIACPADREVAATSPGGAVVEFISDVSASDNCDAPMVVCLPASGSVLPVGTNLLTCTATDLAGNTNACTFSIVVTPPDAPALICSDDIVVSAGAGEADALVSWSISATGDPAPGVTCVLGGTNITSPLVFPLGVSTVTCTASNAAGSTNCSFTVTVNCTPTLVERAQLLADLWPGYEDSDPEEFIVFRDALYFWAETPQHGEELWRFDGTNVELVADLWPGNDSSYPDDLFVWDDALYFQARTPSHGGELRKFDGTNVTLVVDINPGPDGSYPEEFVEFGGAVYFTVEQDPARGSELWKFDGTNATLVADIRDGPDSSYHYYKTVLNGALYFVPGRKLLFCETARIIDGLRRTLLRRFSVRPPSNQPNSPSTTTPLLSDLTRGFVGARLSGRARRLGARPCPRPQFPPDHVQVVAQHAQAGIPQIASEPHVQAAVQSVVFQAVDLALHRAVLLSQRHKFPAAFAFHFRRVFLAALGHHYFGNVESEQLPVLFAGEAFVETDARHAAGTVAAQQPLRHRDALIHFGLV